MTAENPPPGNFSENVASNKTDIEFENLMRAEGAKIYTLAVRLTGNLADGQDLAQETFIKAYKSFSQFRGESSFGTWVYRICVNLWKNRVKYEKRRFFWKHFSLDGRGDEDDVASLEIAAPDAPIDHRMEIAERNRLVQDALSQLEPGARVILIMREMEDKPYEEIAALLDLPLGTVKSRLARGREALKELLKTKLFK